MAKKNEKKTIEHNFQDITEKTKHQTQPPPKLEISVTPEG